MWKCGGVSPGRGFRHEERTKSLLAAHRRDALAAPVFAVNGRVWRSAIDYLWLRHGEVDRLESSFPGHFFRVESGKMP
jgi:hypothetical protein